MRSASGSRATATATSRAPPRDRRPITPGRVLKWVALAIAGWLLLSLVLFLISAQTQDGVSAATERALSSSGSLFTGSNILVLGSDVRTGESIDESQSGPGRSDTIMLVHAAFGSVRKLSIPRDVEVEVPGHGINKINAAYAFGGPALTIETVESFLGQRPRGEPRRRGGLQELPRLHRLARRGDREQQDTRLLAPVRQLLEGPQLQEGRDRAERDARAGLRAGAEEQLRARPRTTAPARRASSRC